jgi:GTP-binding protein
MSSAYRQARFTLAVHRLEDLPPDTGVEVAFAGRSNAGKSTAINAITGIGGLARVSKQPGRTQSINFFRLDPQRALVDLPGYGFARVSQAIKDRWQTTLARYLETRRALRGLILVMDVRHPLTEYDRQMLLWCHRAGLPVHCLLTKADKLKRGAAANALLSVRRRLAQDSPDASAGLFSGLKRSGLDEVHAVLDRWFGFH